MSYNLSQASSMNSQGSYNSPNCVNPTNATSNYLTLQCTNPLSNISSGNMNFTGAFNITDLDTVTQDGWFVVTVYLQQDSTVNSTLPTQIWTISSQDGGQSYNNASALVLDENSTNAGKRNLQVFMSHEHAYISWEQEMPTGNFDVFAVESHDGGVTYSAPDNKSRSPAADSFDSVLWGSEIDGKWGITWKEQLPDGTIVMTTCGRC